MQETFRQRCSSVEVPSAFHQTDSAAKDAVSITNLSFAYTGAEEPSIEVGEFRVGRGEIILVTGRSGSGKSTLSNCINGVIPHMLHGSLEGKVLTCGLDTVQTPLPNMSWHIGTLLQDPDSQLLNYTVEEEVAFGPENLCLPTDEIRQRVFEALQITGMTHHTDRETYTLSGGEKQRLILASILAMNPPLLILDEPTSNIDPEGTESIFGILRSLSRKKTILIVEHKVERVLPFIDRLILVEGGRIRMDIGKSEILHHLDELTSAGVEVPEHYQIARKLDLDSTDMETVRKHARKSGYTLRSPERTTGGNIVLEAKSCVRAGSSVIVDTDMTIREGEVLAVTGRNGAGKSTLLNSLCGMLDSKLKSDISLKVMGRDLSHATVQEIGKNVAYIPQSFDIVLVNSTVEDEISYSLRKRNRADRESLRPKVDEYISMFSLEELRKCDPLTLSFGQRRRVVIASVLASGARIILMDEPTSGQDFHNREMLGREMFVLKSSGLSFAVVTHDTRFVYRHADRMIVMEEGKKTLEGTPEECFRTSSRYGIVPPSDFFLRC